MPEIKKAELIEGIVYMGSPVYVSHAAPDSLIQTWLGYYAARTPGTVGLTNVTFRLDSDNVVQPDCLLRIASEFGGQMRVDEDGYLRGAPELVVEIAATSAAIDFHQKRRVYRRAGVREYLIWRTLDQKFDWLILAQDEYQASAPDARGVISSLHFPGLALAVDALLARDAAKTLDVLQDALQQPAHASFVAALARKPPA